MSKKAKTELEKIYDVMAENKENRGFIHEEDTSQVAELKKTFKKIH